MTYKQKQESTATWLLKLFATSPKTICHIGFFNSTRQMVLYNDFRTTIYKKT